MCRWSCRSRVTAHGGYWAAASRFGQWHRQWVRICRQSKTAQWDFNPLAWQLLFVLGVLARCQPLYPTLSAHRAGWLVSVLAFGVVLGAACYKLFVEHTPLDASFRRNLSWFRAGNFLAIAWLAAHLIRAGWVRKLAQWLPWVGMIGRKGLLCFVAGAVISLVVDLLLYTATDGYLDIPLGLLGDVVAVGTLFAVAWVCEPVKRLLTRSAIRRSGVAL